MAGHTWRKELRAKKRQQSYNSSEQGIRVRENKLRAIELRKCGLNYREIGQAMGVTAVVAWKWVRSVLDETAKKCDEGAEHLRQIELERMDELWSNIWPAAKQGDLDYIKACMRIMERRAQLLGLDAPKKLEVDANVTSDIDQQLTVLIAGIKSGGQVPPALEIDGPPKPVAAGRAMGLLLDTSGTRVREDSRRS